jgi:hypothetical protein
MANMYDVLARRVPPKIRAIILQEQFIDKALNVELRDTPMEYLFDVYQEFVDSTREYDDWSCHKCRGACAGDMEEDEAVPGKGRNR